jgi:hypothetical protein
MACCVHSIDGKVVESIAGDTLKDIAAQLDEWMTKAERDDITNSVKKKSRPNWPTIFQSIPTQTASFWHSCAARLKSASNA